MNQQFKYCLPVVAISLAFFAVAKAHAADQFSVAFANCTEFVGVAPVPETAARALVPNRYIPIADATGARIVVRVADCRSVRVGNLAPRPGRVAHIGVMIVSPDGTATDPNTSINNYTITYASNVPALVLYLRGASVPAVLDPDLTYEVTPPQGSSELYAAVTPEFGSAPTWFLHGTVTDPSFATPFLANWWSASGNKETKMATTFPTILFDFTSVVSFYTSRSNVIGRLLGSNTIANFPLSFRGAYTTADLVVTVAP